MKLALALEIAERAKGRLFPYCHRIEIAGSIRREVPEPRDIELVCIPKGSELMNFSMMVKKWPKVKGEPTGKYTQRVVDGMKLDLFICASLATWAVNFTIRTGSADFSHGLAIWARKNGCYFKDAQLWSSDGGTHLVSGIEEEQDLFRFLGLKWVEPRDRIGSGAIQAERGILK